MSKRIAKTKTLPADVPHGQADTLDGLTLDPHNLNAGNDEGRDLVRTSLERFGAGRSIVVDKHGTAIAGNKTLEQARIMGLKARIVETDGSELVVVKRTDLDLSKDDKAVGLGFADNRSSEVGLTWMPEAIQFVAEEFPGAFAGLVTDQQLAELCQNIPADNKLIDEAAMKQTGNECPKCGFRW